MEKCKRAVFWVGQGEAFVEHNAGSSWGGWVKSWSYLARFYTVAKDGDNWMTGTVLCQSWDAEFSKTLPKIYQYLRLFLRMINQCFRYTVSKHSVTQHGVYCVETEPSPFWVCAHPPEFSWKWKQENSPRAMYEEEPWQPPTEGLATQYGRQPLPPSFGSFNAQSFSQTNPRNPFLRIIFRYIFKAKFSAQTLTLAAKHLQMMTTWGANIGLEVKSGKGSWLGIFGNYVTSMGFTPPLPPHTDSGFLTQRCCRERMNKPLRTLDTLITRW